MKNALKEFYLNLKEKVNLKIEFENQIFVISYVVNRIYLSPQTNDVVMYIPHVDVNVTKISVETERIKEKAHLLNNVFFLSF